MTSKQLSDIILCKLNFLVELKYLLGFSLAFWENVQTKNLFPWCRHPNFQGTKAGINARYWEGKHIYGFRLFYEHGIIVRLPMDHTNLCNKLQKKFKKRKTVPAFLIKFGDISYGKHKLIISTILRGFYT